MGIQVFLIAAAPPKRPTSRLKRPRAGAGERVLAAKHSARHQPSQNTW